MARRRGLTLLEVLVVIAVVAVLLGLAVMGVVRVRAAAARADCGNRLKQIALACHSVHQLHRQMPPAFGFFPYQRLTSGDTGLGNLFFHLLPHLEQHPLYESGRYLPASKPQLNFLFYNTNNVWKTPIPLFQCPSDPTMMPGVNPATQYAPSSYAGNYLVFGNVDARFENKNAQGKPQLGSTFRDGVSTTILFTEKYASSWIRADLNAGEKYDGGSQWAYFQGDCRNPFIAYVEPLRKGQPSWSDRKGVGPASPGDPRNSRFQIQPNADGGCNPCLASTGHSALSVVMADASVRNLSGDMDRFVWWALLTPAGNEPPPSDW
jgi:prepilin-type N-terminal cleavage/methylation domain-containing protein